LYNCVADGGYKKNFYNRINEVDFNSGRPAYVITVQELHNCVFKQKVGKATGPDDIAMEAIVNGGPKLAVHLCFLFNLFLQFSYMPSGIMQSVIVPLVKDKSGDLSDVNNYRAIAISTSMCKLFESIVASEVGSPDDADKYQFCFKKGHSTSLCTDIFKKTVSYYNNRSSYVFTCFIDFTKAFHRVNYWKMFNKLLDDGIDSSIVAVLAYWYSNQLICVRWQSSVSNSFSIGNSTRQGG